MVQVYRYYQGVTPDSKMSGGTCYVEWPQCCHMAWIGKLHTADIKDIAKAMVDHDNGYVGTFLCSIYKEGYPSGSYKGHYDRVRDDLKKLGFQKIATIPGPQRLGYHGVDMDIWMYSMIEHKTFRKLKETFKEYLS